MPAFSSRPSDDWDPPTDSDETSVLDDLDVKVEELAETDEDAVVVPIPVPPTDEEEQNELEELEKSALALALEEKKLGLEELGLEEEDEVAA